MANYCIDVTENVTGANANWSVPLNKSLGAINSFGCIEGFVWDTTDTLRTFSQSLNCVANISLFGNWLYEGNKFYGWPPHALSCKRNSHSAFSFFVYFCFAFEICRNFNHTIKFYS